MTIFCFFEEQRGMGGKREVNERRTEEDGKRMVLF